MPFLDDLKRVRVILRQTFHKRRRRKEPPLPLVVDYYERLLLPPLAIFVGTVMVVYGHHIPFGHFIRRLDFYKAAIPSIAAAWLVMRLVVRDTRVLDGNCPWWRGWWPAPFRRVVMQCYLGVVKPAFFILGIFSIYFLVRSRADLIPRYIREDLPLVILLLTGFNLLCWAYHQARMDELLGQWTSWTRRIRKDLPVEEQEAALLPGVEVISYDQRVKDTVALYEPSGRGNNITLATGMDGKQQVETQSLKEIQELVMGEYFFRLRREIIVNRSVIAEVREADDGVDVVLGAPRVGTVVRVSKRQERAFMEWWERSL